MVVPTEGAVMAEENTTNIIATTLHNSDDSDSQISAPRDRHREAGQAE